MPSLEPVSTPSRSNRDDRWAAMCGSLALALLCLAYGWAQLATGSGPIPPADPTVVEARIGTPLHVRQLVNQSLAPDSADTRPAIVCITLQLIDATPIPSSANANDDGSLPGCATSDPMTPEPATLVA